MHKGQFPKYITKKILNTLCYISNTKKDKIKIIYFL